MNEMSFPLPAERWQQQLRWEYGAQDIHMELLHNRLRCNGIQWTWSDYTGTVDEHVDNSESVQGGLEHGPE